jgi:hypothetical protein
MSNTQTEQLIDLEIKHLTTHTRLLSHSFSLTFEQSDLAFLTIPVQNHTCRCSPSP